MHHLSKVILVHFQKYRTKYNSRIPKGCNYSRYGYYLSLLISYIELRKCGTSGIYCWRYLNTRKVHMIVHTISIYSNKRLILVLSSCLH